MFLLNLTRLTFQFVIFDCLKVTILGFRSRGLVHCTILKWFPFSYVEIVCLHQKPGGIISLLDEAWYALSFSDWLVCLFNNPIRSCFLLVQHSMFPKSTHETFSQKLFQTFKEHKRFSKPKLSPTDFTISHYAGEVLYCLAMILSLLIKFKLKLSVLDVFHIFARLLINQTTLSTRTRII